MITLSVVDARVRRHKIAEQTGDQFVPRGDVTSRTTALRGYTDQQFLFGVFESEDRWTALSVNSIVGCHDGAMSEVDLQREADVLWDAFKQAGKRQYSAVFLEDGRTFRVKSVGLSCSFQNIVLMLERLPVDVTLDE